MGPIDKLVVVAADGSESSPDTQKSEFESKSLSWSDRREALRRDINEHGICRVPSGSHELPSIDHTGWYDWQFYLRAPLLQAKHLHFIAASFWHYNAKHFRAAPFQIAGTEQAALPIITAIVMTAPAPLHAFSIRKERKDYGKCNIIEGEPDRELPVMLIDDLTSIQHNSIWHAIRVIHRVGLRLYPRAFVVVFKGERFGSPRVLRTSAGQVAIESLFTLSDFDLSYETYHSKRTPPV